jgi:hypothetical protein
MKSRHTRDVDAGIRSHFDKLNTAVINLIMILIISYKSISIFFIIKNKFIIFSLNLLLFTQ